MKVAPVLAVVLACGAAAPAAAEPVVTQQASQPKRYVAEIVDSAFVVGPAEFFALDLPPDPTGARAIHLLGTVSVTDRKGDIQVRIFRAPEYQSWLKKRGGEKAGAIWVSKRARNISLDQDLTPGGPYVVLLDNGYSMRKTKHLKAQLQIQYELTGERTGLAAGDSTAGKTEEDIITPRANAEEDIPPPPPPPPPPDEGSK